eukprot:CAMPEP_0116826380 /NCGR_PEP_ID=MMETSP0418-20121206/2497_1 /TAXON_ID=1158023 /ORGANISM="Astrosyne radiata, Strain 13vi08-1A" /LENGTH=333 /DNA_ID=CAMNT_0004455009 /DNA_START=149 /DNA_END=1150 /DNA_ORIENTATION=-
MFSRSSKLKQIKEPKDVVVISEFLGCSIILKASDVYCNTAAAKNFFGSTRDSFDSESGIPPRCDLCNDHLIFGAQPQQPQQPQRCSPNFTMTSESPRSEEILVLFASQTGNSEEAAKNLCELIPEKLSSQNIQRLTGCKDTITLSARSLQLDDFLEIERACWTRLIVIVLSSYGVGQAPLGGYRFRELCDAIIERKKSGMLSGLTFALLGLGDSKFTTFFQNPTKTNEALRFAGAKRIGSLGKADAAGDQLESIDQWISTIWPALATAVVQAPPSDERMKAIREETLALCMEINPDMAPKKAFQLRLEIILILAALPIIFAIISALYTLNNRD